MKNAIYAGSFDPFTNGHLEILEKAAELFDHVYLVIARNQTKQRLLFPYQVKRAIEKILFAKGIVNVNVDIYTGLIVDFAEKYDVNYIIRGLRNPNDYAYEENIAKINKELNPNIQTIYFRSNNEIVSSSMVKELFMYKKNISKYVSKEISELMEGTR